MSRDVSRHAADAHHTTPRALIRTFLERLRPAARTQPVDSAGDESGWTHLRQPEAEADKVLSDEAKTWLRHLPEFAWPKMLCCRYPRVANHLARAWSSPDALEALLDSLLFDARGGRSGFAPSIRAELVRLARFYETAKPSVEQWREEAASDDRSWRRLA